MMYSRTFLLIAVFVPAILAGCASKQGPYRPVSTPPALENTETCVILTPDYQNRIGVEGQQAIRLEDNRLQAQSNIRNLTPQPIHIQVSTVFKDANSFSLDDETPWETILLSENETKTYSANSMRSEAEFYTIRIRALR